MRLFRTRVRKTEEELQEIAWKISDSVYERATENTSGRRRHTNISEQEMMYRVTYGALLALNDCPVDDCHNYFATSDSEDGVLEATEKIFDLLFPTFDGYLSVYRPLWRILENWEYTSDEKEAM